VPKPISVLVTGVGGRSFGHQVLQTLLNHTGDYHLTVCDASPFSYGLFDGVQSYVVPPAHDPGYLEAIEFIVLQRGIEVIVPGTEIEVRTLVSVRSLFDRLGVVLLAGSESIIKLCSNKWDLTCWLKENGYAIPLSATRDDWKWLIGQVGFPIIAKPTEGSGASRLVEILASTEEVDMYLFHVGDARQIMFQQYVGDANSEFTVGVMIDKEGDLIDSIALRRNLVGLSLGQVRNLGSRDVVLSTGYSQGYFERNELVQSTCENLAKNLRIVGPLNVQCRVQDGAVYIFEVHPRFSGTTSLRALSGFDEVHILLRNFLFGEKFERLNYQSNMVAIRGFSNRVISFEDLGKLDRTP